MSKVVWLQCAKCIWSSLPAANLPPIKFGVDLAGTSIVWTRLPYIDVHISYYPLMCILQEYLIRLEYLWPSIALECWHGNMRLKHSTEIHQT